MSLKRYAAKRDASEAAIVQALAAVGAQVIRLEPFDLLVLHQGRLWMLDAKTGTERMRTKTQQRLVAEGWPLHFVTTPDEALRVILPAGT